MALPGGGRVEVSSVDVGEAGKATDTGFWRQRALVDTRGCF